MAPCVANRRTLDAVAGAFAPRPLPARRGTA